MNFLSKVGLAGSKERVHHATAEDIRKAFVRHREELDWLALFLTGNEELAEACVVDACTIAVTHSEVFDEWLGRWARRATIRSAIEMQGRRIAQLASAYEQHPCSHRSHPALKMEEIQLIVARSELFRFRLDVLSRFALILHGIERYSLVDSALMLGMSKTAMGAAYCAALESLDILSCELLAESEETATRELQQWCPDTDNLVGRG